MNGLFSSPIFKVLEKSIEGSTVRHQVLSNNLANIDTPGFKRSDVEFKSLLRQSLSNKGIRGNLTNPRHIPIGRKSLNDIYPKIYRDNSTTMRLDGNNVDIELEGAEMAKNTIYHSAMVQQLIKKFNTLQTVISEGRR
ncbi:flagellar basal body rod protein FlgB [Anaerobranca gottschalkii]|uniref:Flagellar basal body rod protein FlgB n=1 Tax=Anaerobranca gottschalkii DSM 13577 TaxID=1120990 RepID=A0A1H9ZDV2_9FIRM|nr:flagellar basal body rod protein FlgB [Anaerobranca gottschalkii]SES79724.1 flagellar basal-body rod protein FlgB [Anaerobranca gottschalkii DSM 13577]